MATGYRPPRQPPHEVDEQQNLNPPPITKPQHHQNSIQPLARTYAEILQNKNHSSFKAQPFKPFSVDRSTLLKGNIQTKSQFVFGDFDSKNSCPLKPIVDYCGKKAILFQQSDKDRLLGKIQHVLLGKFSHGRPPMYAIKEFFCSLKLKGSYNLSLFDSKHLYIECELSEDFIRIWLEKLWIVKGFHMRIFKWCPDFKPTKESSIAPIWVHLNGLPLYLFEKEALLSIANAIGNPLLVSKENLNRSNLSCASFCVELDVTKQFLDEIWIDFGKEMKDTKVHSEAKSDGFWQKVEYGYIPQYCSVCAHIDHSLKSCKQRKLKCPRESKGGMEMEFNDLADVSSTAPLEPAGVKGAQLLVDTENVAGGSATQELVVMEAANGELTAGNLPSCLLQQESDLLAEEKFPGLVTKTVTAFELEARETRTIKEDQDGNIYRIGDQLGIERGATSNLLDSSSQILKQQTDGTVKETKETTLEEGEIAEETSVLLHIDLFEEEDKDAGSAGGTATSRKTDLGAVATEVSSAGGIAADSVAATGELTRVLPHAGETAAGVQPSVLEYQGFGAGKTTAQESLHTGAELSTLTETAGIKTGWVDGAEINPLVKEVLGVGGPKQNIVSNNDDVKCNKYIAIQKHESNANSQQIEVQASKTLQEKSMEPNIKQNAGALLQMERVQSPAEVQISAGIVLGAGQSAGISSAAGEYKHAVWVENKQTGTQQGDGTNSEERQQKMMDWSTIEGFAMEEIEMLMASPTRIDPVFTITVPNLNNEAILDLEGTPVLCSEVIRKSSRIADVREHFKFLSNEKLVAEMVEEGKYEEFIMDAMKAYTKEIHRTFLEQEKSIYPKDSATEKVTPKASTMDEKEWTTPKRRGRNRNRPK